MVVKEYPQGVHPGMKCCYTGVLIEGTRYVDADGYSMCEAAYEEGTEEEKAQAKADALQANQLPDLEASPLRILPKSPARQHLRIGSASAA